ncbi:hypothetical protein [Halopseudomonas aestusnigri]|jgi:hypothetical protein|uniref:hypothetical protein n=1 Tax=Halopseudomonas aestusnigri TaxID=857252 RepID=UPI000C8CC400|nr:hypothetical protein [Pseudomonadales bacterium]|tara:strand:- start:836 stop:1669 length:834 start_codon:yes stop_codon:yes gene_type:complete
MPKNENDTLSEILPDWSLDDREVMWLWLVLTATERIQLDECKLNSKSMRDQIAKRLRRQQAHLKDLNDARDVALLPEEAFSWIEANERQARWLVSAISQRTGLQISSSVFRTLSAKNQVIAVTDFWDRPFDRKEVMLTRLAQAWTEQLRADRIFEWFKGPDEHAKCAVAWAWLEKNKPQLTKRFDSIATVDDLLELFDKSNASNEEKELYVEKIKRRWSTQKTREKATHKKQYNFVLTDRINSILDELADAHQLSRTKVLELLLLGEIEHRMYIDPR